MRRAEILQRLQTIKDRGNRALQLLQSAQIAPAAQAEAQRLGGWIKAELEREYLRMSPEGVQRTMTVFELSVYFPTIDEAWRDTGINRLRLDERPSQEWQPILEAVVHKAGKNVP